MPRTVLCVLIPLLLLACPIDSSRSSVVRKDIYEKMEEINRFVEKENHEKSLRILNSINLSTLNPYEKTLLLNMRAHIYFSTGRVEESLKIYFELLKSRAVSKQFRRAIKGAVAGIYFSVEKYSEALDFIDSNIASPSPSEVALKGFCFYKLGDYSKASQLMEKAAGQSKKPPENWLVILQSSYKETKEKQKRLKTVEKLSQFYPTRTNLLLLSSMYAERGRITKQTAVLKLIYEAGKLKKEKYLLLLSRLLFNKGLFLEAAEIMEKGIKDENIEKTVKNLEFVSLCHLRSKERQKAVPPLKEAVRTATDNKSCIELADVYRRLEKWEDAISTADKCLKKPDGGENHRIHIIKGQSLFNLSRMERAREEFSKALKLKKSENTALRWLIYIEEETKRLKRLSDAGIERRRDF